MSKPSEPTGFTTIKDAWEALTPETQQMIREYIAQVHREKPQPVGST